VGVHKNQRGPWWPELDQTFGVKKLLRYGLVDRIEDERVRFTFRQAFGSIPEGARLDFSVAGNENSRAFLPVEPNGARVIAADAQGRPALLEHRVGAGRWVLCTYPLEHRAAQTAGVNPEPTWRIYSALAELAGVAPQVSVPDPRVTVGELVQEGGRRCRLVHQPGRRAAALLPHAARGSLAAPAPGGRRAGLRRRFLRAAAVWSPGLGVEVLTPSGRWSMSRR
jgi:hypothetical protein